jgi:CIC family chloride channel protein
MAITTGSGGIGGVFAPSLFIGGFTGFVYAKLLNLTNFFHLSEKNFSLVAMAGMISGVMAAPLTAIFLIAEITSGYELFIPLIVTATLAQLTARYFEKHSIYSRKLARKGELITHHKDNAVLTVLKLDRFIETDFETVKPENNLGELVEVISRSNRNIFPVVDENENFLGMVQLDNIRNIMFEHDKYQTIFVKDLMNMPPLVIQENDNMQKVLKLFEISGAWNLPVLNQRAYVGFVSKSKIFTSYRKVLIDFSDE